MEHVFGGAWTDDKLSKLRAYLVSYRAIFTKSEKAKYFTTWYVDAFAGTGHRSPSSSVKKMDMTMEEDMQDAETTGFLEGSAKIALGLESPFDRYLFIEKSKKRVDALRLMIDQEFPALVARCEIRQEDSNKALCGWCNERNWKKDRAVVFLDPYGMQVDWTTVESLAKTKAVDLWYLFPLGVARLMTHDGTIEETWSNRLDRVFGTTAWRERFYQTQTQTDLFGQYESVERDATVENIQGFIGERLKACFSQIAPSLILRNSKSSPQFALCFASANEKGAGIAVKIAKHILGSQEN